MLIRLLTNGINTRNNIAFTAKKPPEVLKRNMENAKQAIFTSASNFQNAKASEVLYAKGMSMPIIPGNSFLLVKQYINQDSNTDTFTHDYLDSFKHVAQRYELPANNPEYKRYSREVILIFDIAQSCFKYLSDKRENVENCADLLNTNLVKMLNEYLTRY